MSDLRTKIAYILSPVILYISMIFTLSWNHMCRNVGLQYFRSSASITHSLELSWKEQTFLYLKAMKAVITVAGVDSGIITDTVISMTL